MFDLKKDCRVLQVFKLEIKDEAEADALISQNLTCHITGIIYKVEEFWSTISVQQCWNCQHFRNSAKTCKSKTKCLICGESHNHKGCPDREKKQPKCASCKGPHIASYKRVFSVQKTSIYTTCDGQSKIICCHFTPKHDIIISPKIRHSHFQLNSL